MGIISPGCCCTGVDTSGCPCCDTDTACSGASGLSITIDGVTPGYICDGCTNWNKTYRGELTEFIEDPIADSYCLWEVNPTTGSPGCVASRPGLADFEIICGSFEHIPFSGSPFSTSGLLTEIAVYEGTDQIGQWQYFAEANAGEGVSGSPPYTTDCCSPPLGAWQDFAPSGHIDRCNWGSATISISGTCAECA